MHQRSSLAAAALLALAVTASPAAADGGLIDEVKLGVLAHDVGFLGDAVEGGADLMGEVLFKSPEIFGIIGAPRPTLGASVNTAGKTDYLYFDFTWNYTFFHDVINAQDGFYVGGFLGGALHDGHLNSRPSGDTTDKLLGTRALYHLGLELGYQINPVNSVEIYFDHLSNADASSHNAGLNNVGLRTGFKF